MSCMNVTRALLVRTLFACHGIMAIWRLYMVTQQFWNWWLGGALLGLLVETLITLTKNNGKEWKWFCPSVFFYLGSVVPAIWFLELHEMEKRINLKENLNTTVVKHSANQTEEDLRVSIEGLGFEIAIPLALTSDLWLRVLEQFLLLMLIIGRWLLPKGSISHDQLSQLLLVYVGTAADIVEFYEAFNEDEVKYNRFLCYIILGIWSLSLLQFTMVLTASKSRRDHVGLPIGMQDLKKNTGCCNPEFYGIMTSIFLQDLPFLVVRLMLIFKYKVVSYTNMFFTSKNSVVIILLIYRLVVVQMEARKRKRKAKQGTLLSAAASMNDINANGTKPFFIDKGGRRFQNRMDVSRSTPNMLDLTDTLGKHGIKKGKTGPRQSTSSLHTLKGSEGSLRGVNTMPKKAKGRPKNSIPREKLKR